MKITEIHVHAEGKNKLYKRIVLCASEIKPAILSMFCLSTTRGSGLTMCGQL